MSAGQKDTCRPIEVPIDEDEFLAFVVRVPIGKSMLPNGHPQPTTSPTSVAGDFTGRKEKLVRQIKMCEMLLLTTVMSMIAHQYEVRSTKPILLVKLMNNLPNQPIGFSDRSSR